MGLFDNLPNWAMWLGAAALGALLFYLAYTYVFNKDKKKKHRRESEEEGGEGLEEKKGGSKGQQTPPPPPPAKLILFKSETCGHCKNFIPTWEELKKRLGEVIQFEEHEAGQVPELAQKYGINSVPKIFLLVGSSQPVEFTGGRTVEEITKFLQEKLGGGPPPTPAPSKN